ncbi:MAG TPA: M14 family zinc carboxypeptidase [Pyrinomonadaceae bacterium]|nr:M14 family zinc carboxypeptidase [Pyrinomonadaceae bacterium]
MRLYTFALLLFVSSAALFHQSYFTAQPATGSQIGVPAPADVLGFTPGDDRKLASWDQVVEYFKRLDQASDRVMFEELGKSTMGKPFMMATISSPVNLSRLEEFKNIQEQLADPRKLGTPAVRDRKAAELIARGKTIVLITCGIHSTEVGSYLSSMLIAHRLASSNDNEVQNILNNTIVLLVPSLNPDGVDIVKNWYDKTLGTPYEGTDPPELYHKYTGHDDNRDWYAFTQIETQITVGKIHNVWHPQIVHDIHQQGSFGSRLFLPPYMHPVEPNVPKQIVEGYTELGNYLARQMRSKGFQAVATDSTYDAWSPSRAYSHYHGGVRILSETASARIASPLTVKFEDLTSREGYDPKKESANFGPLWHGGEWHLRDITNTMTTCASFLLKHAAENREAWLRRFYAIGKEAVRPRKKGELRGFLVPMPNKNGTLSFATNEARFLDILRVAGVEVDRLASPLNYRGQRFEMLSGVVNLSQPYGQFAKALFEVQHYPDLRDSTGHPIAPYDVTAHNLAMLMGIKPTPFVEPVHYQRMKIGPTVLSRFGNRDIGLTLLRSSVPANDEGWTRWILEHQQYNYSVVQDVEVRQGKLPRNTHAILIPDQPARTIFNGYRTGAMPTELTGGLGQEGVKTLQQFVEDGGTLVCLNRASEFAIEQFKLPLRNVVAGLARTLFYVPGSILRLELDTTHSIANGMPKESIAWAEDSPAFEVIQNSNSSVPAANVHIIGWYPRDKDPLLSGWLLGADRIKGKAALVEVTMGKGRIILFGFRPQYRAQSLATYPLFFNALSSR